jgi:DNA-3-methyladenine glycosylase II
MTSDASRSAMALDHPGWLTDDHGHARRAFKSGDMLWAVTCDPTNVWLDPHIEIIQPGKTTEQPAADWFDPTTLPKLFHTAQPIREGVRICRIRNPSLWDALLPPILHQRRTVSHAAKQYRGLCAADGHRIATTAGPVLLPPTPETVAVLPDQAFFELGMRGKQEHLRSAAEAYLKHADRWATLSPAALFTALQTVTYIGAATAGAAVADITNDHSFSTIHPHIAYRHWQRLVTALTDIPTQDDFVNAWTHLSQKQRSTLLVLLLAHREDGKGNQIPRS